MSACFFARVACGLSASRITALRPFGRFCIVLEASLLHSCASRPSRRRGLYAVALQSVLSAATNSGVLVNRRG